jgi:hypothetical protein
MAAFRRAVSSGQAHSSRNNATLACEHLERAEAGDATCRKLCIERIFPVRRERPVRFASPPIEKPADVPVPAASQSVTTSLPKARITLSEAGKWGRLQAMAIEKGEQQYCVGTVEGRGKSSTSTASTRAFG